jgi:hypothetical protein
VAFSEEKCKATEVKVLYYEILLSELVIIVQFMLLQSVSL